MAHADVEWMNANLVYISVERPRWLEPLAHTREVKSHQEVPAIPSVFAQVFELVRAENVTHAWPLVGNAAPARRGDALRHEMWRTRSGAWVIVLSTPPTAQLHSRTLAQSCKHT
jgi:hypothetical protein